MKETINNSFKVLPAPMFCRITLAAVLALLSIANSFSQTPSPTPHDKRGLGLENNPANTSPTDQSKSREPPTLKAGPLDGLARAEPEDAVIIYFAGHGTAQGQRFYLIPHDLGYEGNRSELNESGLKTILSHSISDVELEEAVEGVAASSLLLVIDACNSGQALEAEEKRRGPMNSKGLAQLAYEKGMYILTAAQSYQAALEAAQFGHGLLTYALVEEGLKTGAADNQPKDGVLSAREWLDFGTKDCRS